MNSTTNDDDNANDAMTWKVVQTGKSDTPLCKPKHSEQGQSNRNERESKPSARTVATKTMVDSGQKFTLALWKCAS
jgi:hypothetical protein